MRYVGKAYHEEKRDRLAGVQFGLAKERDPQDPTPWFYDGIRKQSGGDPIGALGDLQESVHLNDNRAIYRSQLLLDQDRAARQASRARVYDDLGLGQFAIYEASRSLSDDNKSSSAHRLLSDLYSHSDWHESARLSELFQAQILQPLNLVPVEPRLGFTNLALLPGSGIATPGFNEFTPLFERSGGQVFVSALAGSLDTLAGETVFAGLRGPLSISAGTFTYRTDGFRPNDDLSHDISDLFAQIAISPSVNLIAEFRHRRSESGDLQLEFDPDLFSPSERNSVSQNLKRIGGRFALSTSSDVLIAFTDSHQKGERILPDPTSVSSHLTSDDKGYQTDVVYLGRFSKAQVLLGYRGQRIDFTARSAFDGTPLFGVPCVPSSPCLEKVPLHKEESSLYVYSNYAVTRDINFTLGLARYEADLSNFKWERWSPKLGVHWNPTDATRISLAAFESIKPFLAINESLEPTQVAGLTQLFDDANLAKSRRVGLAADHWLTRSHFLGIRLSSREVETPVFNRDFTFHRLDNEREKSAEASLTWLPRRDLAINANLLFEDFKRNVEDTFNDDPTHVRTWSLPLALRYFGPTGVFGQVAFTKVWHDVERLQRSVAKAGKDDFFLMDVALGARFPNRMGQALLEVRNLFDKSFSFYDVSFFSPAPRSPRFLPTRTLMLTLTLAF